MTLSIGTKLGRYEIRKKIGEGGMGEVYQATDNDLNRTVALKILPAHIASQQNRLQRFVLEAKAASALNHPHILTIYEIGAVGDLRFIATEFVEGEIGIYRANLVRLKKQLAEDGIRADYSHPPERRAWMLSRRRTSI